MALTFDIGGGPRNKKTCSQTVLRGGGCRVTLSGPWTIAFGQGASARWIPVHDVLTAIGPEKVSGILFFHAFTGCDVASGFRGKGKKSAWLTWNVCDEASETFTKLSHCPSEVSDNDLQKLENFVVLMYDRSSAATGVDEARLDLFARKQRSYDALPPTRAALMEHVKRAAHQSGIIWGQATVPNPETGSPADWDWNQAGEMWQIHIHGQPFHQLQHAAKN